MAIAGRLGAGAEGGERGGDVAVEGENLVELGDGEEETDVLGDVGEGDFAVEAGEPFDERHQGAEAGGFHVADGIKVEDETVALALIEQGQEREESSSEVPESRSRTSTVTTQTPSR